MHDCASMSNEATASEREEEEEKEDDPASRSEAQISVVLSETGEILSWILYESDVQCGRTGRF